LLDYNPLEAVKNTRMGLEFDLHLAVPKNDWRFFFIFFGGGGVGECYFFFLGFASNEGIGAYLKILEKKE